MDEFGLLSSFKNLEELSVNKHNTIQARHSLHLEDVAVQSRSAVDLMGDFAVDDFKFELSQDDEPGRLLSLSSHDGRVKYDDITLPTWVLKNTQNDINLFDFSNDAQYVGLLHGDILQYSEGVNVKSNDFIYSADIINLKNRPSFDDLKNHYGYAADFCRESSLGSSLVDIAQARCNVGIGTVAMQNTDYVNFDKLSVMDGIRLPSSFKANHFLILNNNTLSNVAYDFPLLTDTVPSNSNSNTNTLPTLLLFSNLFDKANSDLLDTQLSNQQFMTSNLEETAQFLYEETLFRADNLMSNTTASQKEACRENINIGSIGVQNSNDVHVNQIDVDALHSFRSNSVYVDNDWIDIDHFKTTNSSGESDAPFFINLDHILTIRGASVTSNVIDSSLSILQEKGNNISLSDFDTGFVYGGSNLEDLEDLSNASAQLKLHPVSFTGELKELTNRPRYISELEEDVNYLRRNLNLGGIHPLFLEKCRQGIGVSNMALEDADNIGGTEGIPLGVANKKFHSTDTVLNTVFAQKDRFILKTLDPLSEVGHDFLCVEKFDETIPGLRNFKYRYKKIEKCDDAFFTGPFLFDQSQHVRVRVNDLSDTVVLDEIGDQEVVGESRIADDYIIADYLVPSCKFTYTKFKSMASNILHAMNIPESYFTGDLDSIEYFNRQF